MGVALARGVQANMMGNARAPHLAPYALNRRARPAAPRVRSGCPSPVTCAHCRHRATRPPRSRRAAARARAARRRAAQRVLREPPRAPATAHRLLSARVALSRARDFGAFGVCDGLLRAQPTRM